MVLIVPIGPGGGRGEVWGGPGGLGRRTRWGLSHGCAGTRPSLGTEGNGTTGTTGTRPGEPMGNVVVLIHPWGTTLDVVEWTRPLEGTRTTEGGTVGNRTLGPGLGTGG